MNRDDADTLYAVSVTCTHLRCVVSWDAAERSSDSPCHGLRFSATDEVLQGPTFPLELREL